MLAVEIRILNEKALADAMAGMREWLDHRRVEVATFRYIFTAPGIVCRLDFGSDAEAAKFAKAFDGQVVGVAAAPATAQK